MKKKWNRILACILTLTMLLTMTNMAVFADTVEGTGPDWNKVYLQQGTTRITDEYEAGLTGNINLPGGLDTNYSFKITASDNEELIKLINQWGMNSWKVQRLANADENNKVDITVTATNKKDKSKVYEKSFIITVKRSDGSTIMDIFNDVKIFEAIKGENEDLQNVNMPLKFFKDPCPTTFYGCITNNKFHNWGKYEKSPNARVKIEAISSSEPSIISTDNKEIKIVSFPESATDIQLTFKISDLDNEFEEKEVILGLKVKPKFNVIAAISDEILFDAIRGENESKDSIKKQLILPNNSNPFYGKFDEEGNITWGGVTGNQDVKVEIESIDNEIIKVDKNLINIKDFPEVRRIINLTANVTSTSNNGLTKSVTLPLTILKDKKIDFLSIVENKLFDSIKGENISNDDINSNFILPDGKNPYFSKIDENGQFIGWSGENGKVKVEIIKSSKPEFLKVESNLLEILKYPEQNTNIDLTFKLSEVGNDVNNKEVILGITLKTKYTQDEEAVKEKLKGYIDTYLIPENISYNSYKKDGESFLKDYNNGQVRHTFRMPNVAELAEDKNANNIKRRIISSNEEFAKIIYLYSVEPIRDDIDGEYRNVNITYTLTEGDVSVAKDFSFTIDPITLGEIKKEETQIKLVKEKFFDGIKGNNYSKDYVTDSLNSFQGVIYDYEKDELKWIANAKEKKGYGFELVDDSFEVNYPKEGDKGFFDSSKTTLPLERRPTKDTKVKVSQHISSILFKKYAEIYSNNEVYKAIVNQPVITDVMVKAVNADINNISIDNTTLIVNEKDKYSILTEEILEDITLSVDLKNKGARIIVNSTDWKHNHSHKISLINGFNNISIAVSDKDKNESASTLKERHINCAIVSKTYLEDGINKLPEYTENVEENYLNIASELLIQFNSLIDEDKDKIANRNKLEAYADKVPDIKDVYKKELELVSRNLFEGIKGQNNSSNCVYSDFNAIYFAKVNGDAVNFTKEIENSTVEVIWKESSSPSHINVFNGVIFPNYALAFEINKRPYRNDGDKEIVFTGVLKHLKDGTLSKNVEVKFTLKAYNARLSSLSADNKNIALSDDKFEYTIVNKDVKKEKISLDLETVIPGAKVSINGKTIDKTKTFDVPLSNGKASITLKINDEIHNTYDEKWDEREYVINVESGVNALISQINTLPEEVTIANYKDVKALLAEIKISYDGLGDEEKSKVTNAEKYTSMNTKAENFAKKSDSDLRTLTIIEFDSCIAGAIDLKAFSDADKEKINGEIVIAKDNINKATGIDDIIEALETAKAHVESFAKDIQLTNAKTSALEELKNYGREDNYEGINLEAFRKAKEDGKNAIKGAVSVKDVKEALDDAKTIIKNLQTKPQPPVVKPEETISVKFQLIGDEILIDKKIEVKPRSTAYDVFKKALGEAGFTYVAKGNSYVSSITANGKTLKEFDHGKYSGWMYTLNNVYPDMMSLIPVYDDDVMVFYFEKDYRNTEWDPSQRPDDPHNPSGGGGVAPEEKPEAKPETKPEGDKVTSTVETESKTDSTGKAEATVKEDAVKDSLKDALDAAKKAETEGKKDVKPVVEVKVNADKNAKQVETKLPANAIKEVAKDSKAELKVSTPVGDINLDNKALKEIAKNAGTGEVKLSVAKPDTSKMPAAQKKEVEKIAAGRPVLELAVTAGTKKISSFGGGSVTVSVPYTVAKGENAANLVVYFVDDNGKATPMETSYDAKTGKINFQTGHFSTYVVGYKEGATKEEQIKAVKDLDLRLTSTASKGKIKITWKGGNYKVVDGYEVHKSTKKFSGFGVKPYFKTTNEKKTTYTNTKGLKKGTRYFYKVRAYKYVDGKKIYSDWSTKAYRIAK